MFGAREYKEIHFVRVDHYLIEFQFERRTAVKMKFLLCFVVAGFFGEKVFPISSENTNVDNLPIFRFFFLKKQLNRSMELL